MPLASRRYQFGMSPDDLRKLISQQQQSYLSMKQSYGVASLGNSHTQMPVKTNTFKEGDVVVLVDVGDYDIGPSNPVWSKYHVKGRIRHVDYDGDIYINWENGEHNSYRSGHGYEIKLFSDIEPPAPVRPKKIDFTPLNKLVIDQAAKEEIISVLKQHGNYSKLFEDWGLGEIIKYGKGMTFLFYGPPGTGKTWGAQLIAEALGQELLTVGAAEIQTSEPGGANRNIQNAFATAKSSGKVLFFDECDSLITSRNDVGMVLGSEINTLLTEIEKFEGVCVLATNRIDTLDEALERRIALILEFPEPNFEQRQDIWMTLTPKKLPIGKDVKFEKLAEFKLTGGQIKNSILQAARLALSEESKTVDMKFFDAAIKRVQQSKSLLGTASRYRQVLLHEDFKKGAAI